MNEKERLLAAIADLHSYLVHHPDQERCPVCPRWDELQQAALALVRAHDRDGELLDWLERNPRHESAPYFDDEAGAWGFPYEVSNAGGHGGGVGFRHFGSLRAAIDAAMRAEG